MTDASERHKTRTLWLCGALHAFTHVYHVALLPLYLRIQQDLNLGSVEQATLLVTVLGLAYFVPSYPLGALADRMSRKKLLAAGLAINGLGFVMLSFLLNSLAGLDESVSWLADLSVFHTLNPSAILAGRALPLVGSLVTVGMWLVGIVAATAILDRKNL